jgi:fumarate hydratase class II
MTSFNRNCAAGIRPNLPKIQEYWELLMLVTPRAPHRYENAARCSTPI